MKAPPAISTGLVAMALLLAEPCLAAIAVRTQRSDSGVELAWPGSVMRPDGSVCRPWFELQRSLDLRTWQPISARVRLDEAAAGVGSDLVARVPAADTRAFFRLLAIEAGAGAYLASEVGDMLGYTEAFEEELYRLGPMPVKAFEAEYASDAEYLPRIEWDPTTAWYWDLFDADPGVYNQGLIPGVDDERLADLRIYDDEMDIFHRNGFVVSQRLGGGSFAEVFYRLWRDDLPVFVSTDAILQAWHRTFDAMLEEIEETVLFQSVDRLLAGMAGQLLAAWELTDDGELAESVRDADLFLTVARSLLAGPRNPVASVLGQDRRVAEMLALVASEQLGRAELFGACRAVDFSQFTVRGHYEHSEQLGRYFQCVTWLGRIDLRIAGGPFQDCPGEAPHLASPRELAGAVVLWHLLRRAGEFETWLAMDRTLQAFVGWSDSANVAHLDQLLPAAGINSLADLPDLAAAERLQRLILEGELGVQNIRSDFFVSPVGAERIRLPRSFTLSGQRFSLDGWALQNVVYDYVHWIENGVTNKVCRRVPSALDVAFAVFGNDQVVPDIVARITDARAGASRDSLVRCAMGCPISTTWQRCATSSIASRTGVGRTTLPSRGSTRCGRCRPPRPTLAIRRRCGRGRGP